MGRSGRMMTAFVVFSGVVLLAATPAASQDDEIESDICLACHEEMAGSLEDGPHWIGSIRGETGRRMDCISCHSGGAVHVDDPNPDNIGNPAAFPPGEAIALCGSCHQPHQPSGALGFDPHIDLNLACTDCHSVHSPTVYGATGDEAGLCAQCHVSVTAEFRKTSSHPLLTSGLDCVSCHDFTGGGNPQFGHGATSNCYDCHPDQSGPFLFEHQATSSFSPEGDGCTSCHNPHGSANERLLAQPDDRLCRQCHGVPPLHRTQHDGLAMNYQCIECHSAIHGSYDNAGLLDAQLGSRIGGEPESCFCHNVYE